MMVKVDPQDRRQVRKRHSLNRRPRESGESRRTPIVQLHPRPDGRTAELRSQNADVKRRVVRHEQLASESGVKLLPHLGEGRSAANIRRRNSMNVSEAPGRSAKVRIDQRCASLDDNAVKDVSKPERARTVLRARLEVDGKKGTGQSHAHKSQPLPRSDTPPPRPSS